MLRTTFYPETMAARARPVVLRLVRRDGRAVAPARRPHRPAWALLYALVLSTLAALVAIELLLPEGWGRSVAELAGVIGCIALTRLWIGWNRWSLVRAASQGRPEGAGRAGDPVPDREVG
jgi:hypothetical protein